jgi:hypothetical protein
MLMLMVQAATAICLEKGTRLDQSQSELGSRGAGDELKVNLREMNTVNREFNGNARRPRLIDRIGGSKKRICFSFSSSLRERQRCLKYTSNILVHFQATS